MVLLFLGVAVVFGIAAAVTKEVRWLAVSFVCYLAAVAVPALEALANH